MTNSDISTQVSIFQPTVYINLDHEVVFRKNLMGIFILSLVIISYNYFSILTSQGKLEPAAVLPGLQLNISRRGAARLLRVRVLHDGG